MKRVMVCDDAAFMRMMIKDILVKNGYEIAAEAENGLKDFLAENTMMNAAIEQMDGVVSWTAFPGDAGLEAEQLLLDMRDQILGGQVSAKDGMTSTQDAINQLLDAQ